MPREVSLVCALTVALAVSHPAVAQEDDASCAEERIVNGRLTYGFPTAVALLRSDVPHEAPEPSNGVLVCTGTLIGCSRVLTANHCFADDRDPAHHFVFLQHAGFVAVSRISEPPDAPAHGAAPIDLAVIELATPVEGIVPEKLNRTEPTPPGSDARIVGFGRTGGLNNYDQGLKRIGPVRLTDCAHGSAERRLCWEFSGYAKDEDGANTCDADSGGPLYAGRCKERVLAGVTSAGERASCLADHAWDIEVRAYVDWIEKTACDGKTGRLETRECGDLHPVGHANTVRHHKVARALPGQAQTLRVAVPHGVKRMVVAVHGEQSPHSDVDLSVAFGPQKTPSCDADGAGLFAACTFDDPPAGDWWVDVSQGGSGVSTYQLIMTLYRAHGAP